MTVPRRRVLGGTLAAIPGAALLALSSKGLTAEYVEPLGGCCFTAGAKTDGTVDITTTFEEVLAAHPVVVGGPGTFRLTRTVTIPPNRLIVLHPDCALRWDAEGRMLVVPSNNVQWGGGILDGFNQRLSTGWTVTPTGKHVRLVGATVRNWGSLAHDEDWGRQGEAIHLQRGTETTGNLNTLIRNVKIDRCARSGVLLQGGTGFAVRATTITRIGGRFPNGGANQPGTNILIEPGEPLATEPKYLLDGIIDACHLGAVDPDCFAVNVAGADFTGPIVASKLTGAPSRFVAPGAAYSETP